MAEVIDRFVGEFSFLSNFHPSTIVVSGKFYPSVEHAYQAMKTFDATTHETIRKAKTPGEAKKLGRCVTLRPDWEHVKIDLMRSLVKKKFENPLLREMLLATEDVPLVEGNNWNDCFYGVCRGKGTNWLGKILIEVRNEIRAEVAAESVIDDKFVI